MPIVPQPASQYTLQFRFLATVTFHGFDNTSRMLKFATNDGGDKTMTTGVARPGGMDGPVKMAGLDDRDDGTLNKPYDLAADPGNELWLEENMGCPCDVYLQPLGANKLPVGTGRTKTALLTGVAGPKSDSTSDTPPELGVTVVFDA